MEIAAVLVGMVILLFVTLGVIAAVKVTRAVGRGIERAGTEVRRGIDETTLKVKSAQPGPVGQAARTRLELRSSIDGTRRELTAAAAHDPSLSEAIGLLDRLHDHARIVDRELGHLMDHEPDRARIADRLPEVRQRVASIKESADSLRHAAQDRARQYDADELAALREQIEIESGALRHWTPPPEVVEPTSGWDRETGAEPGADSHPDPTRDSGPDSGSVRRELPESDRNARQDFGERLRKDRAPVDKDRPHNAS